jgi:hypothetical protein
VISDNDEFRKCVGCRRKRVKAKKEKGKNGIGKFSEKS